MRLRATAPNHVWSYVPQGFPLVTLSLSEMLMVVRSGCSRWLMSSVESVWPSSAPEGLDRSRWLNNWPTPWWSMVSQSTSEMIMAQNLLLQSYRVDYLVLEWRLLTLNQGALGRMAFVKALMAPLGITFWMGRSSTAWGKLRKSWVNGSSKWPKEIPLGATILGPIAHWITDHQHPKPKYPESSRINPCCCNDLL